MGDCSGVLNDTPGCSPALRTAVWSVCTTRTLPISSVPSILPLERHTREIGGIQAPQAKGTTAGHPEASQALVRLVTDSHDPIIRHCHQPIGSVSLLNVPVAVDLMSVALMMDSLVVMPTTELILPFNVDGHFSDSHASPSPSRSR